MSGYSIPSREDDPIHTVRTIGRMAQILLELRNEYVEQPRPEILRQIEQRLDDLHSLREELRIRIAAHNERADSPD
jgi:hypothetical protein